VKFILYGVSIMVLLATAVVGGIFLYVLLRLALVKNCEEYDSALDHLRDPCYTGSAKREKNDFFEEPI
tara:strand:- start:536 stop:739 length:204 start_codon:yes stop_codon:yes gene_type:complete